MLRIYGLYFLAAISTFACALTVRAQETVKVDITASLKRTTPKGPMLVFTIRNNEAVDLKTRYRNLPWIVQRNLVLAAVPVRSPRESLGGLHAFQTPTDEALSIKAGESISGEVVLGREFLALEEALKKSDVVVFWSYTFETVDGLRSPRSGGFALLQRAANPE